MGQRSEGALEIGRGTTHLHEIRVHLHQLRRSLERLVAGSAQDEVDAPDRAESYGPRGDCSKRPHPRGELRAGLLVFKRAAAFQLAGVASRGFVPVPARVILILCDPISCLRALRK
jgi:hypothetical protein